MPKLIMYKGLPASGKTTHAREQVEGSNGKTKRINKDDLRAMLHGFWTKSLERDIIAARDALVIMFLCQGYDVIVDDTNLQPAHEPALRDIAAKYEADFEIKDFTDVSLEECLRRDQKRPNYVGEKVIKTMHNSFLNKKRHVAQYTKLEDNPDLPPAVIVDIDGTLAHMQDRGPFDYDKVYTDIVDPVVSEIVRRYHQDGYYVLICSGREDNCREETERWLKDNNIPYNALMMRATGDHRKDAIIKQEIFDNYIRPHYNVKFVLDDRDQVIDMWRSLGLKALQVEPGNF